MDQLKYFTTSKKSEIKEFTKPKKDEIKSYLVTKEYNCSICSQNVYNDTIQHKQDMTSYTRWLYQSLLTLEKDDLAMFGGDFYKFSGESYQELTNALSRGANIVFVTTRFFIGGRNKNGYCNNCRNETMGKPYDCDEESRCPPDKPYGCDNVFYPWACLEMNSTIRNLSQRYPKNFYNFDIPNNGNNVEHPYSHIKLISFYYNKKKMFSSFDGGWNMWETNAGTGQKETGIGYVGNLDEPFGLWRAFRDNSIFKILSTYNQVKKEYNILPTVVEDFFKPILSDYTPSRKPIKVKTLYFTGPSYCDTNYGCGTSGLRQDRFKNTCNANNTWITSVDYNVEFYFGVDPPPGKTEVIRDWDKKGWDKNMYYGGELITKFLKDAEKYVKVLIAQQFLDNHINTNSSDPGYWDGDREIWDSITDYIKNKPLLVLQDRIRGNSDWLSNPSSTKQTWGDILKKSPNLYAKSFAICGRSDVPTHDKLWISDNSVIFSSAHPNRSHYNWLIMNQDTLIQNCPGLVSYMNNHWNYFWGKCAKIHKDFKWNFEQDFKLNLWCPGDQKGNCCVSDSTVFNSFDDYDNYPMYYNCNKETNTCESTTNKTEYKDIDSCKAKCKQTYYNCNKETNTCESTTNQTEYKDIDSCKAKCNQTYYNCNKETNTCESTTNQTEYKDIDSCKAKCNQTYYNCNKETNTCESTTNKTEYKDIDSCKAKCIENKKSNSGRNILIIFGVVILIIILYIMILRKVPIKIIILICSLIFIVGLISILILNRKNTPAKLPDGSKLVKSVSFYEDNKEKTLQYLLAVYPTAKDRLNSMDSIELAQFYNSLWFYYNCGAKFEGNIIKPIKGVQTNVMSGWDPIEGCGSKYPMLPYTPQGYIYSFKDWMKDFTPWIYSKSDIDPSTIVGSFPGQTFMNWYNGPAPVWMYQRAIFRMVYDTGLPEIIRDARVPRLLPGFNWKSEWNYPENWWNLVPDYGHIEVTAASEPGMASSPPLVWIDGWPGSGLFFNVGKSFRARNKSDAAFRLAEEMSKTSSGVETMNLWWYASNPYDVLRQLITFGYYDPGTTNTSWANIKGPTIWNGSEKVENCNMLFNYQWQPTSLPYIPVNKTPGTPSINSDNGFWSVSEQQTFDWMNNWCPKGFGVDPLPNECIDTVREGSSYIADRINNSTVFDEAIFSMALWLGYDSVQLSQSSNGAGFWQVEVLCLYDYPKEAKNRDYSEFIEIDHENNTKQQCPVANRSNKENVLVGGVKYRSKFVTTYMRDVYKHFTLRDPFDVNNDEKARSIEPGIPWSTSIDWDYNITAKNHISDMFTRESILNLPNDQRKNSMPKNSMPKNSMRRNSMSEHSIRGNSMRERSMPKNSMPKNSMPKNSMSEHSIRGNSMRERSIIRNSMRKKFYQR